MLATLCGLSQNRDSIALETMFGRAEQHFMQGRKDRVLLVLDTLVIQSKELKIYPIYTKTLLAQTNIYKQLHQFEKAKEAAVKLEEASHKFLSPDDPSFLDIYNSLIVLAHERSESSQREFYLKKARAWFNTYGKSGQVLGSYTYILSNLGAFALDDGDFYKTIDYNQQVLEMIPDSLAATQFFIFVFRKAYENIGSAYVGLKQYKQAIHSFDKAREIHLNNSLQDRDYLNLLNRRASFAFLKDGNSDEAIKLCLGILSNMDVYQSIQQKEFDEAWVYHTLGQAYTDKEDFLAAESSLKQAISLRKSYYEKYLKYYKHNEIGSSIFRLGELYRKQGEKTKALESFQEALIQYSISFDDLDSRSNPELNDLKTTAFYLAEILRSKAEIQFEIAQANQDIQNLEVSLATYQLLIDLIDRDRQRYKAERSKVFLLSQAVPSFEGAISVAMELYKGTKKRIYAESAFDFSEKGKAVLLYSSLKDSEARYIANVPDSLLKKEVQLNIELDLLKENIYQESNTVNLNDSSIKAYKIQAFEVQEKLDQLNRKLEEEFPKYFELKNATGGISIPEIQEILKREDRQLIEFFAGEDRFFVFNIQAQGFSMFEVKRDSFFQEQLTGVLEMLQGIQEYDSQTFDKYSGLLYRTIFENSGIQKRAGHLTIIPDGLLGYLPFEILIDDPEKKTYLIESVAISYAYSAKILFKNLGLIEIDDSESHSWRGYAPEYSGDQYLAFNKEEIREGSRFFSGDTLTGAKASMEDYLTQGPNQAVLHLAMHAYMDLNNPMYSYLSFSPDKNGLSEGKLYVSKIINQKLQADLVVLSACNTGYGPLAKGEGVMSLARAFRLAGCSSILMNLWKSDGSVAVDLMKYFYFNLNEGMTKDDALREAKIAYLAQAAPNRRFPIYWANLVLIGDASPLDQNKNNGFLPGFIIILLGTLLFWGYSKKNKKVIR